VKEAETAENSSFLEEEEEEEGLVAMALRGQPASSEQQQPSTKAKVTNQPLHFFCHVSFFFIFLNSITYFIQEIYFKKVDFTCIIRPSILLKMQAYFYTLKYFCKPTILSDV